MARNDDVQAVPVRIAIVGSGLSGLVAAHLLSPNRAPGVEVHIFERAPKLGMDSNSISVTQPGAKASSSVRIDVPMRSFNAGYYPNLLQLYRKLAIKIRKSDFTYSFATSTPTSESTHCAPSPDFIYNGASGLRGFGLPSQLSLASPAPASLLNEPSASAAFIWQRVPSHVQRVQGYLGTVLSFMLAYFYLVLLSLWHHHLGHTRDPKHPIAKRTLAEWCASKGMSDFFVEKTLVSLLSAVMTAQAESVRHAPVAEVLDYVAATFLRSHYTCGCGVHEVESALTRDLPLRQVHTAAGVVAVQPSQRFAGTACLVVSCNVSGQQGTRTVDGFRHVIFATAAHHTAQFIEGYAGALQLSGMQGTCEERDRLEAMYERLAAFRYEESLVVNHTDRTLLPPLERDWRDLNLVSPAYSAEDEADSQRIEALLLNSSSASSSEDEGAVLRAHKKTSVTRPPLNGAVGFTQTMATHILSQQLPRSDRLWLKSPQLLLQTTNALPHLAPRKEHVLSVSRFERVVLTLAGKAAQAGLFDWSAEPDAVAEAERGRVSRVVRAVGRRAKRVVLPSAGQRVVLGALQGGSDPRMPGVWVCGSWSPGIPLLEGCVTSAHLVVDELLQREGIVPSPL